MKILYIDENNNMRLQEANIGEIKTVCDWNGDGNESEAYQVLNRTNELISDALNTLASDMACILRENGWMSDTVRYLAENQNICPFEDRQSIYFGGHSVLNKAERDAFWTAATDAVKNGDRIFDTEEWFAAFKGCKE